MVAERALRTTGVRGSPPSGGPLRRSGAASCPLRPVRAAGTRSRPWWCSSPRCAPSAYARTGWWSPTTRATSQAAARLWWLLTDAGHPAVRVLNGGLAGWQAEGRPTESGPDRSVSPGDFVARPGQRRQLTTVEIAAGLAEDIGAVAGRRPGGGAVQRGDRADRPGCRAHSRCGQPAGHREPRPAGRFLTPRRSSDGTPRPGSTATPCSTAGPASQRRRACWRWSRPGGPRRSTRDRGATGSVTRSARSRPAQRERLGPPNMISSQLGTVARFAGRTAGPGRARSGPRPRARFRAGSAPRSRGGLLVGARHLGRQLGRHRRVVRLGRRLAVVPAGWARPGS